MDGVFRPWSEILDPGRFATFPWSIQLVYGVYVLTGVVILWRGRTAERIGGVAVLATPFCSWFMVGWDAYHMHWVGLGIDTFLLLVLGVIAMVTGRRWAIVAAAFYALRVATYAALALDLRISVYTANLAMLVWNTGMMLSVLAGAMSARSRSPTWP